MKKKWLVSAGLLSAVILGSGAMLHSAFAATNDPVKSTGQTTEQASTGKTTGQASTGQITGQAVSDGDGETADDQENVTTNATINSNHEKSDGDGEVADDQEQSDGDGEVADDQEAANSK